MTGMNSRLGIAGIVAGAALVLAGAPAQAAEERSWLCEYIPSACGSEDDPGGLPGHAGGAAGSAASERGETRGLGGEQETPADAAAAPAPAPEEKPKEEESKPPQGAEGTR
jgi:hypothetical protein